MLPNQTSRSASSQHVFGEGFELALSLVHDRSQALRIPNLDAANLAEQDGFLAESCTAHECRRNRDASLRIHRHFAGVHEKRAHERTALAAADRELLQTFRNAFPLWFGIECKTALEARDEQESINRLLPWGGAAHRGRN